MERLSLNDNAHQRNPQQQQQFQNQQQNALGPAGQMPTSGPPQLPPQMFTTAAQLLDLTDSMLDEDGMRMTGKVNLLTLYCLKRN